MARAALIGSGALVLIAGLVYNEWVLALLDRDPPLRAETVAGIRSSQLGMLAIGTGLLLGAAILHGVRGAHDRLDRRGIAAKLLVAGLAVLLPLALLELTLQPFYSKRKTSIFVPDAELGWKLRPGAEDLWGRIRVRINAHGLRGPLVEHAKPPGVRRLLFLGDSVTFGFGVEDPQQTFPFLVERMLEGRGTAPIETINAGVGGYSPWQYVLYLKSEGIRYDPDQVIVGFVLNDVTEKFELIRFGGRGDGRQLMYTATSSIDRLLSRSAVAHFARRLGGRLRFGRDVSRGALEHEEMTVRTLVARPDRVDIRHAWDLTLARLDETIEFCADREIPILLVVFPYRFQLDDPESLDAPQRTVLEFARNRGVSALDLLPPLSAEARRLAGGADELFLDPDHLSPRGHEIVARLLAEHLEEDLLRETALASDPSTTHP